MAATKAVSHAGWNRFPHYLIAALAFVVAVNARFIYVAVTTFPGAATSDDFDTSNNYNRLMANAEKQDKLGWSARTSGDGMVPAVDLTGPDHAPLGGAAMTAQAERPLGTFAPVAVTFAEAAPGHYVAAAALPMPGQWDLKLTIAQGSHTIRITRRVILR